MQDAKILLKDLPFNNVKKNTIVTKRGNDFISWYDGKIGGSDNGHYVFEGAAEDIIKTIWDNPEWFLSVGLEKVKYSYDSKSITLHVGLMDAEDIRRIAIAIQRTLTSHYEETTLKMGWSDEATKIEF